MAGDIPGVIIVLGSPNTKDGRLYDVAISGCKTALNEYRNNPGYKFILTGGYGAHFNKSNRPHAWYLARYLIASGAPETDILEFAESANSIEDALFSKPVVWKYHIKRIILVTSDYHQQRAGYIFRQIYHDMDVNILISPAEADFENSELDMRSLIDHEKIAMEKLKRYGLDYYYEK